MMNTKMINVHGSQGCYTLHLTTSENEHLIGLKGGGLGKVLFGQKDDTGEQVVIKANKKDGLPNGLSEPDTVIKLRDRLGDRRQHLVNIIELSVNSDELSELLPGYKFHIEGLAKGKCLEEIYIEDFKKKTESLSIRDRLLIAIQSTEFYKAVNESGFVYLDHKPTDHIFWDQAIENITVIDWNAAEESSDDEKQQKDFLQYCNTIDQILNPCPTFLKNTDGTLTINYQIHPLLWEFPDSEEAFRNQKITYSIWAIISQTRTQNKLLSYYSWDNLILDLKTAMQFGKTEQYLKWMRLNYDIPNFQTISDQLIKVQSEYWRLQGLETFSESDVDQWKNLVGEAQKNARIAARMALTNIDNPNKENYRKIVDLFWLARQLDPSSPRYYVGHEISCLLFSGHDNAPIISLLSSLKEEKSLDWGNLGSLIENLSKEFSGSLRVDIQQIAKVITAYRYFDLSRFEDNYERKLSYLESACQFDPHNQKYSELANQIRKQIRDANLFITLYDDFENTNDLEIRVGFKTKFAEINPQNENQIRLKERALSKIGEAESKLTSERNIRKYYIDGIKSFDPDFIDKMLELIVSEAYVRGDVEHWIDQLAGRRNDLRRFYALHQRLKNLADIDEKRNGLIKLLQDQGEFSSNSTLIEDAQQVEREYWLFQMQKLLRNIPIITIPTNYVFEDAVAIGRKWIQYSKLYKQILPHLDEDETNQKIFITWSDKIRLYMERTIIYCLQHKLLAQANELNQQILAVGEDYV